MILHAVMDHALWLATLSLWLSRVHHTLPTCSCDTANWPLCTDANLLFTSNKWQEFLSTVDHHEKI